MSTSETFCVELKNVSKEFVSFKAVRSLDMGVFEGEFLTLLGPSGCGKTTTLRMIAGLEHPTSGEILIRGNSVNKIPPQKRDTALVFQDYALFPHKSVFENIAFGLRRRRIVDREIKDRVEKGLEMVQLPDVGARMPHQLSGGQQQRVALARALVVQPTVLLLDEPLSNLDQKLRERMRIEIKNIQRKAGITFIYVTHDQEEAMAMSDRIGLMNEGILVQIGKPEEIYFQPANKFVAGFIGHSNFVQATIIETTASNVLLMTKNRQKVRIPKENVKSSTNKVILQFRPERAKVSIEGVHEIEMLDAKVIEEIFLGDKYMYVLSVDGDEIKWVTSSREPFRKESAVKVCFQGKDCYTYDQL